MIQSDFNIIERKQIMPLVSQITVWIMELASDNQIILSFFPINLNRNVNPTDIFTDILIEITYNRSRGWPQQ